MPPLDPGSSLTPLTSAPRVPFGVSLVADPIGLTRLVCFCWISTLGASSSLFPPPPPPQIAFYFVHWITDLGGAEPTPLRGAEKFVLKFPQPVLRTIVASMPIVQR